MLTSFYFRARSTDGVLLCKTRRVRKTVVVSPLLVEFDLQAKRQLDTTFTFTANPTIKDITPRSSFHRYSVSY